MLKFSIWKTFCISLKRKMLKYSKLQNISENFIVFQGDKDLQILNIRPILLLYKKFTSFSSL